MSEMVVKLTWDGDDLGPNWMNPDNLKALLYGRTCVEPSALVLQVVDHTEWRGNQPEDVVPEQVDEKPQSLEEIGRSFMEKIDRDRQIDQLGFTVDAYLGSEEDD